MPSNPPSTGNPSVGSDQAGSGIAGFLYQEGVAQARAKQPREALGWFRRAADLGHPGAALEAGRVLLFLGTDAGGRYTGRFPTAERHNRVSRP